MSEHHTAYIKSSIIGVIKISEISGNSAVCRQKAVTHIGRRARALKEGSHARALVLFPARPQLVNVASNDRSYIAARIQPRTYSYSLSLFLCAHTGDDSPAVRASMTRVIRPSSSGTTLPRRRGESYIAVRASARGERKGPRSEEKEKDWAEKATREMERREKGN